MVRVNVPFIIWFILISLARLAIGGILFNAAFVITTTVLCLSIANAIAQSMFCVVKLEFQDKDYFAGDNIILKLKVSNRVSLLLSNVEISNRYFTYCVYCTPFFNSEFIRDVSFKKKGLYTIDSFNMSMQDVFGIITVRRNIEVNRNIEIYPKITEYSKDIRSVVGYQKYDKQIRRIENIANSQKNDVKDFRLFMAGDSLKRIHWKLSAKRDKLFVKEYEQTNESNLNIFVDLTQVYGENYIQYDDEAASKVVSIINYFIERKCNIRLFINDAFQSFIPINSYNDFITVLRYFMNTEYYSSTFNLNIGDERRYLSGNNLIILFDPLGNVVLDETRKNKANVVEIYEMIKGV